MDLARGHAALAEHVEALVCLERAVREDPDAPGLRALIEELLELWSRERVVSCSAAAGALLAELPAESALSFAEEVDAGEAALLEALEAEPLAEPLRAEPEPAPEEEPEALALPVFEAEAEPEPVLEAEPEPEAELELQPEPAPDLDAELSAAGEEWQAEGGEPDGALPLRAAAARASELSAHEQPDPPSEPADEDVDGRIRELERWLANLRDRRAEGPRA